MSDSKSQSGQRRTILGVVVHPLAILLGVFAAGPAYLLSNAEFSKANARNALNWQLFFLGALFVLLVALFGVGADLVSVIAGFLILGLFAVDTVFSLYATYRATVGDAWAYPLAPDIV